MPGTAVIVFTGKNVGTLLNDGGSRCWVLNPVRAGSCEYIVCTWNSKSGVGDQEIAAHGAAFLAGRVSGVVPCWRESIPGRKKSKGHLIQFKEYALINVPDVWPGQQNPVAYADDVERVIGTKLSGLKWKRV